MVSDINIVDSTDFNTVIMKYIIYGKIVKQIAFNQKQFLMK